MAAFEIPTLVGFRSKKFDLNHSQQISPSGTTGFIQTIQRTSPFWYAEYTTPPMSMDVYNEAVAFIDGLEGSIGTFLAYDPNRTMPYAYRSAPVGSSPLGGMRVEDQNFAASTLDIVSVTVGGIITKGDYLSVQDDNGVWYLFRAMQTRVADGSGLITSLIVRPRPQIVGLSTSLGIRYQKACCEMKMMGKPNWEDEVDSLPTLQFVGTQYIARAPT